MNKLYDISYFNLCFAITRGGLAPLNIVLPPPTRKSPSSLGKFKTEVPIHVYLITRETHN